jgi:hypothetical protein
MPWGHRSDDMRDPPWGRRRFDRTPPCEPSMGCGAFVGRIVLWTLVACLIVWVWRRYSN